MSINQDIRFRQPDANDPNNPEGFYQSILNLKPAFNMLSGSGPPSPSLGSEGATYIDTLNNTEYLKKEGVWETFFTFSSGTITTGANLGGEGVFDSVLGSSLLFKGLTAGTNVSLINNANDIVINSTAGGTLTNGANTGVGAGVFLNTSPGDIMNFKSLVAGSNISVVSNAFDITISAPSVITGGSNSGLPAAAQVYSGVLGNSLRFKPLYSTSPDLLKIDYSLDVQNIEVKALNKMQYQGTLSNVGAANATVYWVSGPGVSPAISSSIIVDDVSKRLYKFTAKLMYDVVWTNTAGTMSFDIGYFDSGLPVSAINFVSLVTIGFPNNTNNPNIVWSAGVNTYLIPPVGGLAVRFTTVGAVNTATNADICVSVQVIDI